MEQAANKKFRAEWDNRDYYNQRIHVYIAQINMSLLQKEFYSSYINIKMYYSDIKGWITKTNLVEHEETINEINLKLKKILHNYMFLKSKGKGDDVLTGELIDLYDQINILAIISGIVINEKEAQTLKKLQF